MYLLFIGSLFLAAFLPAEAVTLDQTWSEVQALFPAADRIDSVEAEPLATAVRAGGKVLGYVFLTNDILPIPAYSGRPINCLVGVDVTGRIRGVRIVEHAEPILAAGVSEQDLQAYIRQYAGLRAGEDIRIGGAALPDGAVIDGITGATITVMVINRTVVQSARRVAEAYGLTGEAKSAKTVSTAEQPLWVEMWAERQWQIAVLGAGLFLLLAILLFQDGLARHPVLLGRLRTGFLIFTLVFVGWIAMGQLSVVHVLTFIHAVLHGFRWDGFLLDPVLFLLWSFVAFTGLLWGRGVYCGWLCPFGALQELLFRFGRRLGVPHWEPPLVLHERLWAIKYVLLIGLFGLSLQSLGRAELLAEVEPFKTAFGLRFDRSWPFVAYVVLLLLLGLVVRKAYCRYLCALGAALTFPARFRIFEWLRRRRECGRPCQICAHECEVGAIHPTGAINDRECHYCLDCQVTYWSDHKCPPLIDKRKKAERRAWVAAERASKEGP